MPPSPSPAAPSVLVLEQDRALGLALRFSLALEGYRVETFDTSSIFLERLAGAPFDAVIVGQASPSIDAFALLEPLRRRAPKTPVLLTATNPTQALRRQARQNRMVVIEKPLLGDGLVEALKTALGG
ncbi:response regulator [Caulobacter sp. 1776]|uniref:response regulator n=1 Tax=Caulobacter sp. 1776 TaxID=3156420 RepID=UPI0033938106